MAPTPGFLPSFASSPPATLLYSKDKKPRSFPASPIPTQLSRRICALLVFSILCLTVGLGGMAFTVISLRRPPRTVTVFRCGRAEDSFRTYRSNSLGVEGLIARPKVLGFVGVQTGFMSRDLRMALRSTWFPGNPEGLMKLEQSTGLAFRFVIGRTKNTYKLADIKKEDETHHDFLFIDVEEEDARPPYKMLAFFKAAFNHFDAEFYVKADDDIYLRPDRLATLLAKDRTHQHTYIGCMKKGPIVTNPKLKWYESSGHLFGNEYFIHASRQIYALSREVVASLIEARNDSLRIFDNEDVTVGSWMLAMNVKHEDNRALCEPKCTPNSIAIWDISRCSGLCKPADRLRELHNISVCSQSPTLPPEEET